MAAYRFHKVGIPKIPQVARSHVVKLHDPPFCFTFKERINLSLMGKVHQNYSTLNLTHDLFRPKSMKWKKNKISFGQDTNFQGWKIKKKFRVVVSSHASIMSMVQEKLIISIT